MTTIYTVLDNTGSLVYTNTTSENALNYCNTMNSNLKSIQYFNTNQTSLCTALVNNQNLLTMVLRQLNVNDTDINAVVLNSTYTVVSKTLS